MRRAAWALGLVLAARAGFADESTSAPADEPRTQQQWSAITMFHGLPSPNVRAITQDADGILWFGTDAGLVRYDGVRLEREALGAAPARVRALAVDDKGRLWVGTEAGAFVRRGAEFLAVPETAGAPVVAIAPGPDGTVDLAGERGALFSVVPGAGEEIAVRARGPQEIALFRTPDAAALPLVAIARQSSGLLLGTRGRGLLRVEGERVSELPDPNRPFFVTALIQDATGHTFLGAETSAGGRGLFALEGAKTRALDVPTGPVSSFAVDGRGSLWVGTRERGLFEVRDGRAAARVTMETSGGALQSDHVLTVFVDRDGVLWIGTDRGICRYDPGAPRVQRLGPTPRGNFIHALLASRDGRLWAGTQRGLYVREPDRRTWRAAPALGPLTTVYALAEMPDDRLLAGTPGGLYEAPAGGTVWTRVNAHGEDAAANVASVRAVRLFEGVAYLATYGRGLERIEGGERVLVWPAESDDPARRDVVSLSVADGALWIGTTSAGTFVFRSGTVTQDAPLSPLGTVWAVASGTDPGELWIGSERGLHRRRQGFLRPMTVESEVRAVLADDAGAWCATTRSGLLRVAPGPDGAITSRLATDYGLPSDSVYTLASVPGDGLALGTNRGLALYDPGRTPPGLRLRRVLGRRPYPPEEWPALHLEYPQNSLLVETAALGSRTYPEHFQYAFTLRGVGHRWLQHRTSHDGQFVAESLAPGAYCLEAQALDVDLRASAPLSLCFDVARAPMPWTSISLAALLLAALLALAWGYRQNRRLSAANVALSETRLQLVQETENERRRIARDLHDQTLADLRRLLLQAAPYRDAVESISTEVRRICEDLSPSVLANVGLAPALEWALEESVRHLPPESPCRAAYSCPADLGERLALEPAVEIQIYRIVQEALSNVARHAQAGEVRLALSFTDDGGALEITVEDDGRGFDTGTTARGHGLANMRTRASLVGADVAWVARAGGGTVFRLRRPRSIDR